MRRSELCSSTPIAQSVSHSSLNSIHSVPYRMRDSSTSGRVPIYGPKRLVSHGTLFRSDDYETTPRKICVSKSELKNYNIICSLLYSEYQG